MKKNRLIPGFAAMFLAAFLVNCSDSGDSTTESTINAADPGSLSTTLGALEGLLDAIDESAASSNKISTRAQQSISFESSLAGCEANSAVNRAGAKIMESAQPLKYIDLIMDHLGEDLTTDYKVLKLIDDLGNEGEGPEGPSVNETREFYVRAKLTSDKEGVQYELCTPNLNDELAQDESFVAQKVSDGDKVGFELSVQRARQDYDFNGVASTFKESFDFTGYGTEDELNSIDVATNFQDYYGQGVVNVSANRSDLTKKVGSRFTNDFETTDGQTFSDDQDHCAVIVAGRGGANIDSTYTAPPFPQNDQSGLTSWFCPGSDHTAPIEVTACSGSPDCAESCEEVSYAFTEYFKRLSTDTGDEVFWIVDDSPTTDLETLVASCTAPSLEEPVSFKTTWDCSEGISTATEVTLSEVPGFDEAQIEHGFEGEPNSCFGTEPDATTAGN